MSSLLSMKYECFAKNLAVYWNDAVVMMEEKREGKQLLQRIFQNTVC
jgi:hypothetical protein